MHDISKTTLQIYEELVSSGVFERQTQRQLGERLGFNQATISRIAAGRFKRVNKSVRALCKYAKISTTNTIVVDAAREILAQRGAVNDPDRRKLLEIIDLAFGLLARP